MSTEELTPENPEPTEENTSSETQAAETAKPSKKKASVHIGVVGAVILAAIAYLIFTPTLSLGNHNFYGFVVLLLASLSGLMKEKENGDFGGAKLVLMIGSSLFLVLWGVHWVVSWDMFSTSAYYGAIGEVVESTHFHEEIPEADPANIVVFDEVVARNIGEKILGTQATLGSQAYVGTFHLQNVKGKFYWVAPLLHSGFFKYFSNGDAGTPGYVMVSVNDDSDIRLVTEVNGAPLHIVYQMGSHFTRNLNNHLMLNGYLTYHMDTPEFEIDDEGNPFWVIPMSKQRFGSKVMQVDLVLLVNPETGEIQEFTAETVPTWVDRVYTPEILEQHVDWWGNYKHGYWNFSQLDLMQPSGEMVMVYGEEGHCQWYQGMTSIGLDNATVGFVLIDSKSKETRFYNRVGATEESAMSSAEGKVQEKNYYAGHPTAYNIGGEPTYVVPLHDKSNLVKAIAFVNIHDFNHVVVGETLEETLRDYEILMSDKGFENSKVAASKFLGTITRLSQYTQKDKNVTAIWCAEANGRYFVGDPLTYDGLLFAQPGDSIELEYHAVKGINMGNISSFVNKSLEGAQGGESIHVDFD